MPTAIIFGVFVLIIFIAIISAIKKDVSTNKSNDTEYKAERPINTSVSRKIAETKSMKKTYNSYNFCPINTNAFLRYSFRYKVYGINLITNRKISIEVIAQNEDVARRKALNECPNLTAPFTFERTPINDYVSPEPSATQLSYAKDLGIAVPSEAKMRDVSALIDRVKGNDLKSPTEEFARFVYGFGYVDDYRSLRYAGRKCLANAFFNKLDLIDKIAIYCHAVCLKNNGTSIEKAVANLPLDDNLYNIAFELLKDKNVTSLIMDRPGIDLYNPNANTSAYKAVKSFID